MNGLEKCSAPRCRSRDIFIILEGKPLCEKHWEEHCEAEQDFEEMKKERQNVVALMKAENDRIGRLAFGDAH